MKDFGIFYGSTTGATREIAGRIAGLLKVDAADVHNVANTAPSAVADYKTIILGSSTWGSGELQDDWYDFLKGLEVIDLEGKKIAIFGVGDESMSETFCNAVGIIYKALRDTGAEFVGAFPADGYHFDHTEADVDGTIVGLLLDQTNHPEMTDTRLDEWATEVKSKI